MSTSPLHGVGVHPTLSVRVPQELRDRVMIRANVEEYGLNQLVVMLLELYADGIIDIQPSQGH